MKKILACTLVLVLCFMSIATVVYAETEEEKASDVVIDMSILESSEYYNYDKFEKDWKVFGWYKREFSDGTLFMAVDIWDSYLDNEAPEFQAYFCEDSGDYVGASEVHFLLDDTIYGFTEMDQYNNMGYVYGGNVLRTLLKVMPVAKEISFKVELADGRSNTTESVRASEMKEFFEVGELFEKSLIWDYCADRLEEMDNIYGAYIDGDVPTDDEIAALTETNTEGSTSISDEQPTEAFVGPLKKGSKGDEVLKLQTRLLELGYLSGKADGDFGNKTKDAVEAFQSVAGLPVNGEVDEATWNKLFSPNTPAKKANDDDSVPVWNGTDPVLVYEDKYVSITFNGFEEFGYESGDYIPKLMISNKTSKDIYFDWDNVLLDDSVPVIANGGKVLVAANGKTAFETGGKCVIHFTEYAETYNRTEVQIMKMQFTLKNEKGKKLNKNKVYLLVNCGITLSDYTHVD